MISNDLKSLVLASFGPELLSLVLIILLSLVLPQPTWWQAWIMYSVVIVGVNYKQLALLKTFKQLFIVGILLLIFYNINKYFIFGTMFLILTLVSYRIIKDIRKKEKSLYMTGLRDIEVKLFGRTLDKEDKNGKK